MYTHLQSKAREEPPITLSTLRKMKADGEKIACITAYDASFATVVDNAGVDLVLVGDSLGMVIQGHDTTIPVSMDDMIYHCQSTLRGLYRPFLVADLPFMSYSTPDQAASNSARLMQEGKASMVKLEGGAPQLHVVEHLAKCDIPICAHIGLTPQSVHKLGGFRVQGRKSQDADEMVQAAMDLESAGADMVLLECIPTELAGRIHAAVSVPVIGIGAGPEVDGQILVLYDVLDITPGRKPRFSHNFLAGRDSVGAAITAYVDAVKSGEYPAAEHCFV